MIYTDTKYATLCRQLCNSVYCVKICYLLHAHKFRMTGFTMKGNRLACMETKNLFKCFIFSINLRFGFRSDGAQVYSHKWWTSSSKRSCRCVAAACRCLLQYRFYSLCLAIRWFWDLIDSMSCDSSSCSTWISSSKKCSTKNITLEFSWASYSTLQQTVSCFAELD
jgi:hypothetical protein